VSTTSYPGCRCCGQSGSGSGDGPGSGSGGGPGSGSGSGSLEGCCAGYYIPRSIYLTFGGALAFLGTLVLELQNPGGTDPEYLQVPLAPAPGAVWCDGITQVQFTVFCVVVSGPGEPVVRRWQLVGSTRFGFPVTVPRAGTNCFGDLASCAPLLVTFACEVSTNCVTPGLVEPFTAVVTETPP
jgi:hypothetical protein